MNYQICPDCGAALDFGERCDCNKKGSPDGNRSDPGRRLSLHPTIDSIIHDSQKIKNNLKYLRTVKNMSMPGMVEFIRTIYPKFNPAAYIMCERSGEFGVELRKDAMDALLDVYAPELLESEKRKRQDGHRLTKRIACRLEDDEYNRLVRCVREDGFDQMNAWLVYTVRNYLKTKAPKGRYITR